MKISDILGFKHNGLEAIEAKLNGSVVWGKVSPEIAFTSSPFPTSWNTSGKATNDWGQWVIDGDGVNIKYAFDNSNSTMFETESISSNTTTATIEISCPCLIKPTQLYVRYKYVGDGSVVQGYNADTATWEDIFELTKTSSTTKTDTPDVAINKFYSKFRVVFYRYNNLNKIASLYEFRIDTGFIKEV